ncbi:hypothetical protein [Acinetobacter larvae]|uniref:Uncharacterized protein n=1 Tax=Acinetobacter larvae TaxID=1789224 RepID=A0A1B2LX54_9GAMM|nr:hypothetical protein [Acinetobacter larvae]AOA57517.1 hypothetical protein BFG52_03550 [Acinetobacter larvae]
MKNSDISLSDLLIAIVLSAISLSLVIKFVGWNYEFLSKWGLVHQVLAISDNPWYIRSMLFDFLIDALSLLWLIYLTLLYSNRDVRFLRYAIYSFIALLLSDTLKIFISYQSLGQAKLQDALYFHDEIIYHLLMTLLLTPYLLFSKGLKRIFVAHTKIF